MLNRLIRDADWLSAARARAYARVLAAMSAGLLAAWVAIGLIHGGIDPWGRPLGPDFAPHWTAARLSTRGPAAIAYDPARQFAEEQAAFLGEIATGPTPFFYPPAYLLIVAPFAALPYLPALLVWTGLGLAAYWAGARAMWPVPAATLAALAFPAALACVANGQNGLFAAGLFAGGALMLERRPIVAGLCFGCLACKPQLIALAPFALLAWRNRPALLAAAAAVSALGAMSEAAFGIGAWRAFLAASRVARAALEQGLVEQAKLVSVFGAFRLWNAPLPLAYAAQAASALLALAGLWSLRRSCDPFARGAALAAAAPLASPYMFDYDLAILVVPMAFLMRAASAGGVAGGENFMPWEKAALSAAFVAPLVARGVAGHLALPLGPPATAALFWAVWRRGARPSSPRPCIIY